MTLKATYYGSSGWKLDFTDLTLLLDPWLVGEMIFPPGAWLIKGELMKEIEPPPKIDLILLTQGLADHAHPETLKLFDKSIPVVGSPSACKVVRDLGYNKVFELKPSEIITIDGLTIRASKGAPVPNIENAYLLNCGNKSVYCEPHGFLDDSLFGQSIDAAITPIIDLSLPIAGKFIKGKSVLIDLIKQLHPKYILASTTGGDAKFTGFLG